MPYQSAFHRGAISAPWTVWFYGVVQFAGIATSFIAYEMDIASRLGSILLSIVIFVGLLKGARLAWIVAMLFEVLALVASVPLISRILGGESESIWLNLMQLTVVLLGFIVLLDPRTRSWTRSQ